MGKNTLKVVVVLVILLLLLSLMTGCAHTQDVSECLSQEDQAGFWSGTWHGMTSSIAFIIGLFDNSVAIYEVNNNGGWYDFGFVGGLFLIIKLFLISSK